jgi:hypothetical protein
VGSHKTLIHKVKSGVRRILKLQQRLVQCNVSHVRRHHPCSCRNWAASGPSPPMQHICQRWCEGVSALLLWQSWRALKAAVLLLCCAVLCSWTDGSVRNKLLLHTFWRPVCIGRQNLCDSNSWLPWGDGIPCHTLSAADTSHSNTVLCIECVWHLFPVCGVQTQCVASIPFLY